MGILNDLKSIFFGASSVAKSAGEKTGEYLSENADDLIEKGKDLAENIGGTVLDKASSLKDKVLDKSSDLVDSTTEYFETANDILDNDVVTPATNKAKELGDIAAEKGSKLVDKFGEISESVGEKILNKKDELTDKYGDRVASAKDSIVEKAGEVTENMKQKLDDTVANAEKWEAEQAEKYQAGFPKEDFDASGSFLEGTDDFFSKADKFADGDYSAAAEGRMDIGTNDAFEKGKDAISKAAGFTDTDNDGDEIIDDAIIEDLDS